jgi:hypothetical protein
MTTDTGSNNASRVNLGMANHVGPAADSALVGSPSNNPHGNAPSSMTNSPLQHVARLALRVGGATQHGSPAGNELDWLQGSKGLAKKTPTPRSGHTATAVVRTPAVNIRRST